jgi:hypothetical protein
VKFLQHTPVFKSHSEPAAHEKYHIFYLWFCGNLKCVDMDMSYTRVLHPKDAHSVTSRVLRHTAAAMRAHNMLQGTVEQLR